MKKKVFLAFFSLWLVIDAGAQPPWVDLFNGRDLTGWQQRNGSAKFQVEDGMIVGTTVATTQNSFLVTEASYDDFELEVEFKMDSTNSGIQFRSEAKTDLQNGRVMGYQVDFDPTPRQWTGGLYEEGKRGWLYPLVYHPKGKSAYQPGQWNRCRVRCVKHNVQVWINEQPTASVIDDAAASGFIGLQVHGVYRPEDVGKKIFWRNIRVRKVTRPDTQADIFTADLIAARARSAFRVIDNPAEKKVSVYHDETLITEYIYPDSLFKPVLHPLQTLTGIPVTRGFPVTKVVGERTDHPHQVGLFFTHESVNQLDFWNLSTAIPPKKRGKFGRIVHTRTVCAQGLPDRATLITTSLWKSYDQTQSLVEEMTTHVFSISDNLLQYDRTSELRALQTVQFEDRKDALLGIRVARPLELKNDWADSFVEPDLSISKPRIDNTGATGDFLNHDGFTGEGVWGKRSPWLVLSGRVQSKPISLVLFDHPKNLNAPTRWHARGYGLIAANPLGTRFFTEGQSHTDLQLRKGEHIAFRYRLLLTEGLLGRNEIETLFQQFARE